MLHRTVENFADVYNLSQIIIRIIALQAGYTAIGRASGPIVDFQLNFVSIAFVTLRLARVGTNVSS